MYNLVKVSYYCVILRVIEVISIYSVNVITLIQLIIVNQHPNLGDHPGKWQGFTELTEHQDTRVISCEWMVGEHHLVEDCLEQGNCLLSPGLWLTQYGKGVKNCACVALPGRTGQCYSCIFQTGFDEWILEGGQEDQEEECRDWSESNGWEGINLWEGI